MTSHTASAVPFVDADFLLQPRAELSLAAVDELAPVARLQAVPEATPCVSCAGGSALRRR
jgi:hypothetical protein